MARQPQVTRDQILKAAFEAVYEHGLAGASLDAVLARTGVTKGALYHHFECKQDLGCALVDEVLAARVHATWIAPLESAGDPVAALQQLLRRNAGHPSPKMLRYGCPLNNLAQEVSALDEALRARIEAVYQGWVAALKRALRRGQHTGAVRADLDLERTTVFIVGAIEGAMSLGKTTRDGAVLRGALLELAAYLESLRPARTAGRRRAAPRSR